MSTLYRFFSELRHEIVTVSWTLFRVMLPMILLVRLLELFGGIELLARLLEPIMEAVGLPGATGLVWAATLSSNIYTGMLVFFTLPQLEALTVAQVTALGGMMLIGHSLPIEVRIAQQAGIRLPVTLLLRVGGGLLFGWLLFRIYQHGGWLQQPNQLLWQPQPVDNSLPAWALAQLKNLLMVQLIIILLLTGLKLLRLIGVERLMHWLLRPLLRLLGIGQQASTLTIIGITLGLTFGGGLLINEAKQGEISRRDIFFAMLLLGLCHSLIEDTLLVLLLGAHLSGVLWLRLAYALLSVMLLTRLLEQRSEHFWQRYLLRG